MAMDRIKNFREKWSNYEELLVYLNKNYFGEEGSVNAQDKQKHWMICYRQDVSYSGIDTNNYIESWHNTLKRHFFRDKQQRRVDTVIYILAVMAVPHFQQKCLRSAVNVGRMNPAQKNELRLTKVALEHMRTRLTRGYRGEYIIQSSDTTLTVESFIQIGTMYDVKVDFSKSHTGHIISCTCEYFRSHTTCCKHIALVQLELRPMKFYREEQWNYETHFRLNALGYVEEVQPIDDEDDAVLNEFNHIMQRIVDLEPLRDRTAPLPHKEKLIELSQQFIALYEPALRVQPGEDLSNKRRRQGF